MAPAPPTTAASADNKLRDLLLGQDVSGQVELLLNLLSDAAAGKELSNVVSEVIQVTIAGGVGHYAVKKLAYDLCKAVPLLPSDYSLLVDGIKNDISCGVPEGQVLALRFLPHLPADYLLQLLDKGEISNFVAPHTRNVVPSVRCAATSALCALLLVPEVQAAMAASADTAASCSDWWDAVVDSVGDSIPDVVVAGLAATNALYDAAAAAAAGAGGGGSNGGGNGGSGYYGAAVGSGSSSGSSAACVGAAQRATLRLAAGVGPLMDTWRMLPSNAQVPVLQLLGHIWCTLLQMDTTTVAAAVGAAAGASYGGSADTSSSSQQHPVPAAALPGMLSYLSAALSSLNPAVKLEAARVILRVSRLARRGPAGSSVQGSSGSGGGVGGATANSGSSSSSQAVGRLRLVGEVPPSTAAAAIEALLELKGRLLVEAALEEAVSLVAAHLDVLQVPTRLAVLSRLWPLIALLQSPTDRLTAFAHAWQAGLALALDSAAAAAQGHDPPGGTAATLSAILADPFLEDIISEKSTPTGGTGTAAAGGPSSSNNNNSSSVGGAAAAAGATGSGLSPAAAGATGASSFGGSAAAAGPTGGSVMSGGGGGGDGDSFTDELPGGSVVSGSRRKRMMASAKGLVSSGAALAGTMGSSLAAAATGALTALPLRLLWDTPPPAKAQLPATLKQELVCTLLSVLSQHPAAAAALQLPPGKPVPPPKPSPAAAAAAAAAAATKASASSAAGSRPLSRMQSSAQQQQQQQSTANGTAVGAGALLPPPPPAAADGSGADSTAAGTAGGVLSSPQQQQQQQLRPQFGLDDISTSPIVASLQAQVVMWLGAAVSALSASRACLQWEPLVVPPMPGQPPTPPLPPMASVNLTTVPVDSWLQLLQCACHAVRAVVRLHGYDSLKAIYRSNGGRMLAQLSPWDVNGALARTCEAAAAALQQLLTRELAEWKGLALAVRPRVLWVAAHYLELPSLLDDTWSVLLGCVDDAVCRGVDKQEADGHTRQLAASARDGLLLKRFAAPQLAMGRDKAGAHTSFDAAAASALVEMHEYRSDALQAGLTVLQYLVWVVQASIAAQQAATGPLSPPGPSEEALARKLLELVRTAAGNEAAGVDAREWCRRMARTLSAILDPLGTTGHSTGAASGAAAAGGGPAFAMLPPPQPAGGGAAASKAAHLPGGYNAVAGFSALGFGGGGGGGDSSSDDESEDEGAIRRMTREQRLQRKLGLAGSSGAKKGGKKQQRGGFGSSSSSDDSDASGGDGASSASSSSGSDSDSSDSAVGGDSSDDEAGVLGGSSSGDEGDGESAAAPAAANPFSTGSAAAAAAAVAAGAASKPEHHHHGHHHGHRKHAADSSKAAAKAAKKAAKAAKKPAVCRAKAESVAVGAPESASGVWGYPFGGPRSQTLFISRRSRRHRLFKWHLALAMANLHDSDLAGGLGGGGGAAAAAAAAVRSGGYGAGFAGGLFSPALGGGGSSSTRTMAAAGLTDATGPVFSGESGFRLDQPGFWKSLRGVESGWVDLSGPADPVLLSGRYSTSGGAGSAGGDISVTLRAFNRLSVDLEGVEVVLRLVGPVRAERREAAWNLPPLMPTEAAQHTFTITPTGYGRLEVHARLLLPLHQLASEAAVTGPPSLSCQPLVVDMARLLRPPACPPPSAQEVLALWSSLPVQVELSATAVWPGVDGLQLLLSALARQPMHCSWCHMLPVVCGAQAAFVANPTAHTADSIVIMMVAQLMPDEAAAAEAAAAAAAAAEAAEKQAEAAAAAAAAGGGGDSSTTAAAAATAGGGDDAASESSYKGDLYEHLQKQEQQQQQQQGGKPDAAAGATGAAAGAGAAATAATATPTMPMRCVVQLVVRSSSHEVLMAIQQRPEAWVEDISQGNLYCGVSSAAASGGGGQQQQQGKPLLHPLVARLEQQLMGAPLLGAPPPPVPPLALPPPPRFRRKLAAKADEEDSDGEDTELPLTPEEHAEQAKAADKHKEECEKAQEKHAAAKAERASAVLRASALAEWRRTACPPLFMMG